MCTAQTYGHTHTHTWVGRRELAREWRVEMVLLYVGQQAGRGGVDFSDETFFRLVREIVTFASGINS
jgi:hypothetical protein